VSQHPAFIANPFATLKEHLTNSVALQKEQETANETNTTTNNNKHKHKHNKDKKHGKKGVAGLGVNSAIKKQKTPKQATKQLKQKVNTKQKAK